MTEEQRPGEGAPPEPDDVVVPHPFGSGTPAQPTGGPAVGEGSSARAVDDVDEPHVDEPRVDEPRVDEADDDEADDDTAKVEAPEAGEATADGVEAPAVEPEASAAGMDPEPRAEVKDDAAATAVPSKSRRRTRDPLAAALIAVLTLLLGFAFAVQVRSVGDDQQYEGAREEDLVRILDELNAREERLRGQLSDQRSALQQLTSSDSQSAAALEEAQRRAEAIGILNGTIAAQGPGLVMTVRDPDDEVRVADILDAIQELRGAGAETMQIDGVRVGVSTAITGVPGDLMVDGRPITAPYEFIVIGSPQDMETAMNIPGGVVPHISGLGGSVDIVQTDKVVVDALRPLDTPQYAQPEGD